MRSGRRERRNIHLISQRRSSRGDKVQEKNREICACPHFERLADDIRKGIFSKEDAEATEKRLGLHAVGGDGVAVVLCTECYRKGDIIYRQDRNGRRHHLRWPIELDVFKAKGGDEKR
jgi:hypothetical protein